MVKGSSCLSIEQIDAFYESLFVDSCWKMIIVADTVF